MRVGKKFGVMLMVVMAVLFCGESLAQQVEAIPPGEDEIVAIQKDQPAPFTGQLYSTPTALRWANWIKQYQMQLKLADEYSKKTCAVEIDFQKKELASAEKKYQEVVSGYQRELLKVYEQNRDFQQKIDHPPWYKTFWFGAVVGAVAVGGTVTAGYFIFK